MPEIKEPKRPSIPVIEIDKEKTPEPVGKRGSIAEKSGSRRGSLIPEGAGDRRPSLIIADEVSLFTYNHLSPILSTKIPFFCIFKLFY